MVTSLSFAACQPAENGDGTGGAPGTGGVGGARPAQGGGGPIAGSSAVTGGSGPMVGSGGSSNASTGGVPAGGSTVGGAANSSGATSSGGTPGLGGNTAFGGATTGGSGSAITGGNGSAGGGGRPNGGASGTTGGSGGKSGTGGNKSTGTGGSGGAHTVDHCVTGFSVDPRDAQLTGKPDEWKSPSNGDIDLVLPKGVLDWMSERIWDESHDAWHNVRRCKSGGGGIGGGNTAICSHTELIPAHQECSDAEDGFEFLVMHRHMMQTLRATFPQHTELFEGFPKFPFDATDVPEQWRGRWGTGWSQQIKDTANTLEAIEQKLSQFPTEGDLGKYIQCGGTSSGASSIHGALHFKWVVNDSPHSLGKQPVNINNYMFWKLHGWIDTIWERYRVAKGLAPDEAKLRQALIDQCHEMHDLGVAVNPSGAAKNPDTKPLPVEHGVFHETVRPILEKYCSGCHSEASPEANMSLGGNISSADIVANLVNAQSIHGGQFKRVVAGNPDQSWLYLKVAGTAMSAGCTGSSCNSQVMPPTGQVTLTQSELDAISAWITAGAPTPTQ